MIQNTCKRVKTEGETQRSNTRRARFSRLVQRVARHQGCLHLGRLHGAPTAGVRTNVLVAPGSAWKALGSVLVEAEPCAFNQFVFNVFPLCFQSCFVKSG